MRLELLDLRNGYVDVCQAILAEGVDAAPRGAATREVLGAVLVVQDPYDVLPVGTGRKVNTKLAAVEAVQVVGGYSDVSAFARWPHMLDFADQGRFHGAYGPRIRPQLQAAVARLVEDPWSRRAVINVWDPVQDLLVDGVRNYPCTTQLQFFIRRVRDEPRLVLYTTMRANDAWHGLAYDAFVFTQLQITVANALGLVPGPYYHHATSLHLYEEHLELAEGLTKSDEFQGPVVGGFGVPFTDAAVLDAPIRRRNVLADLNEATAMARSIGAEPALERHAITRGERWYCEKLAT